LNDSSPTWNVAIAGAVGAVGLSSHAVVPATIATPIAIAHRETARPGRPRHLPLRFIFCRSVEFALSVIKLPLLL
jgi:hypothetical protein